MFYFEYCEIFKKTYFEEHLQTTASYFIKKRLDTAEAKTTQANKF